MSSNFFDIFAVEMVCRKRDIPNSTKRVAENNDAVWRMPDVLVVDTSGRAHIDTFYPAALSGGVGFSGYLADPGQAVASDHMRGIRFEFGI